MWRSLGCLATGLGHAYPRALVQESTGKGKSNVAIRRLALDRGLNLEDC